MLHWPPDTMSAIIEIKQLTKRYGQRTAIDTLDMSVEAGDIFAFVGPNGAGKTSTIRIIAGLLQPSAGDVYVGGHSVRLEPRKVKRLIGYMPDYFGVYPDLQVWEYLDFFGACYQIPEIERPALISGLLDLVELTHRAKDNVDRLSRGMKQRLSLARTLIHDPQVLILDEPAAGLDPRARVEIRELLVELAGMGKTVFFSTHILSDAADICNRIGIIEAGKLVACGEPEALHLQTDPYRKVQITILDQLEQTQAMLESLEAVRTVIAEKIGDSGRGRLLVEFSGDDQALSELLARMVSAGIQVLHFSEDHRDLEDVFMRMTKGIVT
jgi:ABC-2 type transport system ATP-binding protein